MSRRLMTFTESGGKGTRRGSDAGDTDLTCSRRPRKASSSTCATVKWR